MRCKVTCKTGDFLNVGFSFTVFEKRPGKFESSAELGSSVVINCSIDSVPKMDVTWSLDSNGSDINFALAER